MTSHRGAAACRTFLVGGCTPSVGLRRLGWGLALALAWGWNAPSVAVPADGGSVRIVTPEGDSPAVSRAVERLREYARGREVTVARGGGGGDAANPAGAAADAAGGLTILIGTRRDVPEVARALDAGETGAAASDDAWVVRTVSVDPPVVAAGGAGPRGMLYAAYHLADLIRAGDDLRTLNLSFAPKVPLRYVSFGATTHGRRHYRPELYWKTLNELPRFGYNGVVVYPGGGTPVGRHASPVSEGADGRPHIDPEAAPRWRELYDRIDGYGLDIMMTIPPAVPPGFGARQVRDFYAGGPEPDGYLDALRKHFAEYVTLLRQACPQADRFMFNSTEGATFGRSERFFSRPAPARYAREAYLRNNERVMRAYLDVLTGLFDDEADREKLAFWTHSFGLTSEGVAAMRRVLFEYPRVTIIEDDFWNNNLWPFDLPAMNYLPPGLRAEVSTRNPFGLFQIATDGEYYGGGSLPNAYAGSHVRSAREAVGRGARMVIQRLDLHDRTPYGTVFGTMEIVPLAAARQLWSPAVEEPEVWRGWARRRFGADAAPRVIDALRESEPIIRQGLAGSGIDLLGVGSEFNPRLWMRSDKGLTRFHLFGRPGVPLVPKGPGDEITSEEFTAWQMGARSIPIVEFRRQQAAARAAAERGRARIEEARGSLAPADYEMLAALFDNARHVLTAMRLLGETAYAANLALDNFDKVDDPRRAFDRAAAELETFFAAGRLIPEMNRNLTTILESYRALLR